MLKHIVMMNFEDRDDLESTSKTTKKMLLDLQNSISTLKSMEVGLNFSTRETAFDLILISDFENEDGLNVYRDHPTHIKVLEYLKTVVSKTAVVDYYI